MVNYRFMLETLLPNDIIWACEFNGHTLFSGNSQINYSQAIERDFVIY